MEKVAVRDLKYDLVLRPRSDTHRFINSMNQLSVTEESRSKLDRTLLMSPYYRVNVCTIFTLRPGSRFFKSNGNVGITRYDHRLLH